MNAAVELTGCMVEKGFGDHAALIGNGRSRTYKELADWSNRIAHALVEDYGEQISAMRRRSSPQRHTIRPPARSSVCSKGSLYSFREIFAEAFYRFGVLAESGNIDAFRIQRFLDQFRYLLAKPFIVRTLQRVFGDRILPK